MSSNHLDGLNKHELVTNANEAISTMLHQSEQGPREIRAVGTKKLRNGGVVYKLNSSEATAWLRKEKVVFIEHFGGM